MFASTPLAREHVLGRSCILNPGYRGHLSQFASSALARAHLGVPLAELVKLDEVVPFLDTVRFLFPRGIPEELREQIRHWISQKLLGKYFAEPRKCAEWDGDELKLH